MMDAFLIKQANANEYHKNQLSKHRYYDIPSSSQHVISSKIPSNKKRYLRKKQRNYLKKAIKEHNCNFMGCRTSRIRSIIKQSGYHRIALFWDSLRKYDYGEKLESCDYCLKYCDISSDLGSSGEDYNAEYKKNRVFVREITNYNAKSVRKYNIECKLEYENISNNYINIKCIHFDVYSKGNKDLELFSRSFYIGKWNKYQAIHLKISNLTRYKDVRLLHDICQTYFQLLIPVSLYGNKYFNLYPKWYLCVDDDAQSFQINYKMMINGKWITKMSNKQYRKLMEYNEQFQIDQTDDDEKNNIHIQCRICGSNVCENAYNSWWRTVTCHCFTNNASIDNVCNAYQCKNKLMLFRSDNVQNYDHWKVKDDHEPKYIPKYDTLITFSLIGNTKSDKKNLNNSIDSIYIDLLLIKFQINKVNVSIKDKQDANGNNVLDLMFDHENAIIGSNNNKFYLYNRPWVRVSRVHVGYWKLVDCLVDECKKYFKRIDINSLSGSNAIDFYVLWALKNGNYTVMEEIGIANLKHFMGREYNCSSIVANIICDRYLGYEWIATVMCKGGDYQQEA